MFKDMKYGGTFFAIIYNAVGGLKTSQRSTKLLLVKNLLGHFMGNSITFFKKADPVSIAQIIENITNDKELIKELIKHITAFRNTFDEQLRQTPPRNQDEVSASLLASINKSETCLETLKKMDANQTITPDEQRLLLEYIKPMHIAGVKIIERIVEGKSEVKPAMPG